MDEYGLLLIFYNEMRARKVDHFNLFLSIDEGMVELLADDYDVNTSVRELENLADICIVNGWLERTTADPYYRYLSLTEEGLREIMKHEFKKQ